MKAKKDALPYVARTMTTKRGNQFTKNPKQEAFLEFYYTPGSETFGNIYQSAIRAGYSESYAKVLGAPAINNLWIRENNRVSLGKEHVTTLIERIAVKGNKQGDQLRALELLAKMNGMIIDRSQSVNVNIETALESLK